VRDVGSTARRRRLEARAAIEGMSLSDDVMREIGKLARAPGMAGVVELTG
jgi:hypothetical protein